MPVEPRRSSYRPPTAPPRQPSRRAVPAEQVDGAGAGPPPVEDVTGAVDGDGDPDSATGEPGAGRD